MNDLCILSSHVAADIHNAFLYAVWNGKPSMLSIGAEMNPYSSQYFFWCDVGFFRYSIALRHWPHIDRIEQVMSTVTRDLMLFTAVSELRASEFYFDKPWTKHDCLNGAFYGGTAAAIAWFAPEFYATLEQYRVAGYFIGKDQNSLNAIAMRHVDRISMIPGYLCCACHHHLLTHAPSE